MASGFQLNTSRAAMRRIAINIGMIALNRKADEIATVVRALARPHGSISQTIEIQRNGPQSLKVVSLNPHTLLVHNGSRPHWIRPIGGRRSRTNPRRPGYLRFEIGGRVVFAREVFHPGYKGDPFMTDALRIVAARNS